MDQIKQEIQKEPYEKPVLTSEGSLRDAAGTLVTKDNE